MRSGEGYCRGRQRQSIARIATYSATHSLQLFSNLLGKSGTVKGRKLLEDREKMRNISVRAGGALYQAVNEC